MPSMTCGHCRNTHTSVAEVRACAVNSDVITVPRTDEFSRVYGPDAHFTGTSERSFVSQRQAGSQLPTYANANRLAEFIPAGRYALTEREGERDVVRFYKIDKPIEGRWAGKTFLKALASDAEHPIRQAARQMSVYSRILTVGVAEASRAYGREVGHCGICGRTLTDPESIADGIGPTCKAKMGW